MDQNRLQISLLILVLVREHLEVVCTTDEYEIIGPLDDAQSEKQQDKVIGDTFVYVDEAALNQGQKKPKKNVLRISVLNNNVMSNNKVVFKRPMQQTNNKNKKLRNRVKNGKKNGKNRRKGFTKDKNSELVPVNRNLKTTPEFEVPPNAKNDYYYDDGEYPQETTVRRRRRTRPRNATRTSTLAATPTMTMTAAPQRMETLTSPAAPPEPHKVCAAIDMNESLMCCNLQGMAMLDHLGSAGNCDSEEALTLEEMDSRFMLNLGMDVSGELNLFLPWFQKNYESMCYMHCFFTDQNFLLGNNPKTLRFSEINSYFESNVLNHNGSSWMSVLQEAEDECENALSKQFSRTMPDFIESKETTCFTRPFLYVQCIRRQLLLNCPEPSSAATGEFCKTALDKFRECNPFQTS